ncbi:hypothetical protein K443DRAFT_126551 [Laccaria amethystina LaAM-08-1]|uniref:Uncharacterized protein n=1 Tax=Laccaria amethystina LaAM-08-1 TaxID=1095629 RepID=A0A0C9WR05_9AGAR|nr:hypothetical protein K443DRAFT_126551 [Laccaria amethystina LaAM-08-1]
MSTPLAFPCMVHVRSSSLCPNPLCNIKVPHDFHDLLLVPPIPVGVKQLEVAQFMYPNPFPSVNCWRLVSPLTFNPEDEPQVYLQDGYGTVRLSRMAIEREGWVIYDAHFQSVNAGWKWW